MRLWGEGGWSVQSWEEVGALMWQGDHVKRENHGKCSVILQELFGRSAVEVKQQLRKKALHHCER